MLTKLSENKKGATAIEYALIASLIAIVAIAGMRSIGEKMSSKFDEVAATLSSANNSGVGSGG